MKSMLRSLIVASVALLALPALALDLHEARSSGMVGEKSDGYVTALKPSPEVTKIVSEVNAKRAQEYARISKQNGQTVDVVAKLAAAQIVQTLGKGSRYQAADGSWRTR